MKNCKIYVHDNLLREIEREVVFGSQEEQDDSFDDYDENDLEYFYGKYCK